MSKNDIDGTKVCHKGKRDDKRENIEKLQIWCNGVTNIIHYIKFYTIFVQSLESFLQQICFTIEDGPIIPIKIKIETYQNCLLPSLNSCSKRDPIISYSELLCKVVHLNTRLYILLYMSNMLFLRFITRMLKLQNSKHIMKLLKT